MAQLIVEIHIPLVETRGGLLAGPEPDLEIEPGAELEVERGAGLGLEVEFSWIAAVEEYLVKREESGEFEVYDDGESLGGDYLFFLTGADEQTLLSIAADVARLPGIPTGAYAIVTDDEADELGAGRREPLPQI